MQILTFRKTEGPDKISREQLLWATTGQGAEELVRREQFTVHMYVAKTSSKLQSNQVKLDKA